MSAIKCDFVPRSLFCICLHLWCLTLCTVYGIYFSTFDFLQTLFLVDSTSLPTTLKASSNIYHVPFLAMLLFCFSKLFLPCCHVSPHLLPALPQLQSCLVCEQKQPSQFVVSAVLLHLHHVSLPLCGSLQQDTSSPSTVSSLPTFPPPPQAEVNIEYVKSAGAMKLSTSHCIFLSSEKAGGNKRGGKSSQETKEVFPEKV